MIKYERNCPECFNKIEYKNEKSLYQANYKNVICRNCSNIKKYEIFDGKMKQEEVEKRVIEICDDRNYEFIGFLNNEYKGCRKSRLVIKCNIDGYIWDVLHDNFVNKKSGCQNCNKLNIVERNIGKKPSDDVRRKMSEKAKSRNPISDDTRNKMSESQTGRKRSDDTRKKQRISAINRIEKNKGQCFPNFNPNACILFDNIMKEKKINIQHAKNGGEFYIKELGYWVDGYDEENNIIYEFDERRHFDKNGELLERDKIRQREIEDLLGCKFIRIKE